MTESKPSPISSQQTGLHRNIADVWARRADAKFRRPIATHTAGAFEGILSRMQSAEQLIFDSCCGTGESSMRVAEQYPNALVIGIEKSADRLRRGRRLDSPTTPNCPDNVTWVQADVIDFWRLAVDAGLQLSRHTIFYPNPYPKPEQLNKRWYAHPVFPAILALGGALEARSNWSPYIADFAAVLHQFGRKPAVARTIPAEPISAFEAKYLAAGMFAYRLTCDL